MQLNNQIMKNIIKILILTLVITSCKSQTINIKDRGKIKLEAGQYYKDINNSLNPFVGTWVYTNGNSSLKIVLEKKINLDNGVFREDVIVGGYEYKVNDIIVTNTINELSNDYSNSLKYSISGNGLVNNDFLTPCTNCLPNDKRLLLTFFDRINYMSGTLLIRKTSIGNNAVIKVILSGRSQTYSAGSTPPPNDFSVPSGEYTLIKQT
jgi:hypothetical protein